MLLFISSVCFRMFQCKCKFCHCDSLILSLPSGFSSECKGGVNATRMSSCVCQDMWTHTVCVCGCVHADVTNPTYGLVVDRMNMELKGGMGLGPPSPPLSSSSSSLSSFAGRGSVLAFLLTE